MNGNGHELTTSKAFEILGSNNPNHNIIGDKDTIVQATSGVDQQYDVEFVNVEGGWFPGSSGRDDPHEDSFWDIDDEPHYEEKGHIFTAFNHYIDIKKGAGIFDDYDGYSYEKGSASKDQYQPVTDATDDFWEDLLGFLSGDKVDEGINWWYNDEYVHAPGHPWYQGCSPAIENYSFPQDKGVYASKEAELQARFPLADSTGEDGKGIPYSVFMPVDNMARYWYSEFINNPGSVRDPNNIHPLGYVMHAIQDASVPHHAAGYHGNWHQNYEDDLDNQINNWSTDPLFASEVKGLYGQWSKTVIDPPSHLDVSDWQLTPAINWEIDQLVTWVALNAYKEYDQTYNHFSNGYFFDENSARELTKIATATSLLVLDRVGKLGNDLVNGNSGDNILNGYIGNDNVYGWEGNDSIYGGEGNDLLDGELGDDLLDGELGDDFIVGWNGNDNLIGGWGNDALYGDGGNDSLYGGGDDDYHDGGEGDDLIAGWNGNDNLIGGWGNDALYGGGGNDSLYGGGDDDYHDGGEGDDLIVGWNGNDNLIGRLGNDALYGGGGNDTLTGSGIYDIDANEHDTLEGGLGADIFILGDSMGAHYQNFEYATITNYATITDFDSSEGDKFQVYGSASDYTLTSSGNEININYNGDLIGYVTNTNNVVISRDFNFV